MQGTQRRVYEMFARSRDFKQSRAASFPAASRGGELFAELEEVLAVIEEHTEVQGSQASAAVQGTANRKAARVALQKSLEAIYRTARAMSYDTPGLDKLFRLPRGSNDQSLLITARGFVSELEPLKAEFVRHELASTFHDDLRVRVASLEQSITRQNQSNSARVQAATAIKTAIARGIAIVRQLDAIVRNKFAEDPATLAAWESASRVERTPRRAKPKPTAKGDAPASQ